MLSLVDPEQVDARDVAQGEQGPLVLAVEHDQRAALADHPAQGREGGPGQPLGGVVDQGVHDVHPAGAGPVGQGPRRAAAFIFLGVRWA